MKLENMPYEAPIIEVTEIMIEQGIAQTGNSEDLDWNSPQVW